MLIREQEEDSDEEWVDTDREWEATKDIQEVQEMHAELKSTLKKAKLPKLPKTDAHKDMQEKLEVLEKYFNDLCEHGEAQNAEALLEFLQVEEHRDSEEDEEGTEVYSEQESEEEESEILPKKGKGKKG